MPIETLGSPLLLIRFLALWASSNTCRRHATRLSNPCQMACMMGIELALASPFPCIADGQNMSAFQCMKQMRACFLQALCISNAVSASRAAGQQSHDQRVAFATLQPLHNLVQPCARPDGDCRRCPFHVLRAIVPLAASADQQAVCHKEHALPKVLLQVALGQT